MKGVITAIRDHDHARVRLSNAGISESDITALLTGNLPAVSVNDVRVTVTRRGDGKYAITFANKKG